MDTPKACATQATLVLPRCFELRKPRAKNKKLNGAKRIRTADPLHAMQVLYQLSYGPILRRPGPFA